MTRERLTIEILLAQLNDSSTNVHHIFFASLMYCWLEIKFRKYEYYNITSLRFLREINLNFSALIPLFFHIYKIGKIKSYNSWYIFLINITWYWITLSYRIVTIDFIFSFISPFGKSSEINRDDVLYEQKSKSSA